MQPHNPIEHIVIIVKENHTFDNYFGTFPGANGDATLAHAPDPPPSDPPHDHAAWLRRATGAVRQQYHESDIPAYFAYARQFTLCDNFFTEIASQSEPNHLMLIAADSPIIDNASVHRTYQPQAPFNLPSLPDNLAKAGLTWKSYGDPSFNYFNHIASLKGSPNIASWNQFDADVAAGKLPNVAWVYANSSFDEHPPYGSNAGKPTVTPGMQWTVDRVNQIAKSNLWANTVIFITWDDWGGWYDHVRPFRFGQPNGWGAGFTYGFRIPLLVVSAYTPAGYVDNSDHDIGSILKFIETDFAPPGKPLGPIGPGTYADAYADNSLQAFFTLNSPRPFQRIHVKFNPRLFLEDAARRAFEEMAGCGMGCWF